jgi:hypothetical protein
MFPAKNGVPSCDSTKIPKHKILMLVIQNLIEGFNELGSTISKT